MRSSASCATPSAAGCIRARTRFSATSSRPCSGCKRMKILEPSPFKSPPFHRDEDSTGQECPENYAPVGRAAGGSSIRSTRSRSKRRCGCAERGVATEVTCVTVGPASVDEEIRAAYAMGCDRAIRVDDDRRLDPYAVARILLAVTRAEAPDLVLMGKQAVDDDASQVGPMLAGLLGWPQATFVSRFEPADDRRSATCTRETDGGLEVIAVRSAGGGDDRPAPQRAALRVAAGSHQGAAEADRGEDARRTGRAAWSRRRRCWAWSRRRGGRPA